jgi:hypothetical protein
MSAYIITRARRADLRHLAAIELAAARMLVGHAPDAVLNEITPLPVLNAERVVAARSLLGRAIRR